MPEYWYSYGVIDFKRPYMVRLYDSHDDGAFLGGMKEGMVCKIPSPSSSLFHTPKSPPVALGEDLGKRRLTTPLLLYRTTTEQRRGKTKLA